MKKKGKSLLQQYAQFQVAKGVMALIIAVIIIAFMLLQELLS
jgi:hypothetical protein